MVSACFLQFTDSARLLTHIGLAINNWDADPSPNPDQFSSVYIWSREKNAINVFTANLHSEDVFEALTVQSLLWKARELLRLAATPRIQEDLAIENMAFWDL